jgi:hypothetical protein
MFRGKGKVLLMTTALVVAPLAGVALLLYSAAQVAARRRRTPTTDPYLEWLALRDLSRQRRTAPDADPRSRGQRQ